jgi:hypothetical protein
MPKALMGCPWVGQNESKEEHNWEINRNPSIAISPQRSAFLEWL